MANKIVHRGIIKPTVPNPVIFWGSANEIAEKCNITYRNVLIMFSSAGKNRVSRNGYRAMTEDELEMYYQPPKPPKPPKPLVMKSVVVRMHWVITFFKDWRKGDKYPDPSEEGRKFSGNPQEFIRFINCNAGSVYRMIETHDGLKPKYPVHSIHGWSISRIRRYGSKRK
jgi:hypothetical protein